jgi:hypothetical protein
MSTLCDCGHAMTRLRDYDLYGDVILEWYECPSCGLQEQISSGPHHDDPPAHGPDGAQVPLKQELDGPVELRFATPTSYPVSPEPTLDKARISISYADTIPKCYHTPQGSFDVTATQATLRLVMPNDPSVWVNITLERSGVLQVLQAMFAAQEK